MYLNKSWERDSILYRNIVVCFIKFLGDDKVGDDKNVSY